MVIVSNVIHVTPGNWYLEIKMIKISFMGNHGSNVVARHIIDAHLSVGHIYQVLLQFDKNYRQTRPHVLLETRKLTTCIGILIFIVTNILKYIQNIYI